MNRLAAVSLLLAAVASSTGVGCGDTVGVARCEAGARTACACTNGRKGEQRCQEDLTYGACECGEGPLGDGGSSTTGGSASSGAGAPSPTTAGQGGAETQGGEGPGGEGPTLGGTGGEPQISGGAPTSGGQNDAGSSGCVSEEEWCDGLDNDCDGTIDNGEVCPDDTVANTEPFLDGVYLQGELDGPFTTNEGFAKRFWPTLAETALGPMVGYSTSCNFRRSDEAFFYGDLFYGLFEYHAEQPHTHVFTPPCTDGIYGQPWFDSSATVYYQCGETIRRGNGILVRKEALLFAVLGDGRAIVAKIWPDVDHPDDLVIVTPSGEELSRLNPREELSGALVPDWGSFSVSGNHAYVGFRRTFGQDQRELVVYRVDENNAWQRVRRLPLQDFGAARLPVSDGTVFVQSYEGSSAIITAHHPHQTPVVVWRQADDKKFQSWGEQQLFVGPT